MFGIVGGGAQAEYLAVPAAHCAPVPDGLDLVAMGGVPEVFITAHDAMVTQARVRAGEWVLVHAVGSGVGTAALQLAKRVRRARRRHRAHAKRSSNGAARSASTSGSCPPPTADGALDVDALAWSIVEATGGGADVTLDLVGGAYVEADVAAAAPRGRIVCIGTIAGARATLPVVAILGKRLTLIGTVLRPRDVEEKAAATDAFVRDVVPLLADGPARADRRRDAPARPRRATPTSSSRPTRRSARSSSTAADAAGGAATTVDRRAGVLRRARRLDGERALGVEADHPREHAFEVAGLDDLGDVVRARRA